jgi:hypothetical protein
MFRRAVVALTLAVGPSAHAESIDATLARIPRDAIAVLVVPSLKTASDDLQLALDRMGRAEAALGGRPIDLLKAQARIGPGFDDRGALASWVLPRGDSVAHVAAIPVTDADAFVAGTFSPIPGRDDGAMQWPVGDLTVWVRKTPSHVVLSDRADALGTNEGDAAQGIGPVLAERLGARGGELMRMADLVAWASAPALRRQAAERRAPAEMAAIESRIAELLGQVDDALLTVDFDALAIGVRAMARFAPETEVARAIPSGVPAADARGLLARLPAAPFYGALGVDLEAMGGASRVRQFLATIPGSERVTLPAWIDAVQDKVKQVQVAAFPSKLAILSGGILNDASFVVVTDDPAAVKAALRAWVESQAGEAAGVRREPTWEDARTLKDGSTVTAFAVKETVTGPGGDPLERVFRQLVVSSRGLHGFAREVPGALVVTYSQRTDVLGRATAAASRADGTKVLGDHAVVRAMQPWLVPQPDLVLFVGVGELLAAARQAAESVPGMDPALVPVAGAGIEPLAAAFRSRDRMWEGALVVPSGILGIGFDAARARVMQPDANVPAPAGAPAPAPVPAPVPTPAPTAPSTP